MYRQAALDRPRQDSQATVPRLDVAGVSALVCAASKHAANRQLIVTLLERHGVKHRAAAQLMISEFRYSVGRNYYAAPIRLDSLKRAGNALAVLHGIEPIDWPKPYYSYAAAASGASD